MSNSSLTTQIYECRTLHCRQGIRSHTAGQRGQQRDVATQVENLLKLVGPAQLLRPGLHLWVGKGRSRFSMDTTSGLACAVVVHARAYFTNL